MKPGHAPQASAGWTRTPAISGSRSAGLRRPRRALRGQRGARGRRAGRDAEADRCAADPAQSASAPRDARRPAPELCGSPGRSAESVSTGPASESFALTRCRVGWRLRLRWPFVPDQQSSEQPASFRSRRWGSRGRTVTSGLARRCSRNPRQPSCSSSPKLVRSISTVRSRLRDVRALEDAQPRTAPTLRC